MSASLLLDEIHVSVRVARGLPARDVSAVRRTIMSRAFLARLRRAVRQVVAAELHGRRLQIQVSR
jgi:hypothetical protein